MGLKDIKIEKISEVEESVKKILLAKTPVMADFRIEPEENVFPMVPAGEAINRMIGGMA